MTKVNEKRVKAGKIFEYGDFRITITSDGAVIECFCNFDARGSEWSEIERLGKDETAQLAEVLGQPKQTGPIYRG